MSPVWQTFWKAMLPVSFFIGLMFVLILPLSAQQRCMPEQDFLDSLLRRFGEWPVWRSEHPKEQLILTMSPGGNWSLLRVEDGRACIEASGSSSRFDVGT